jgi:hypothetical protein
MNLNSNPTAENLRELIRECDDSAGNHVLWVKKTGEVKLSRIPRDQSPIGLEKTHADMQIRFATFMAGNEYVGPEAAEDEEWVAELFDSLITKWRQARGKPEIVHMDAF